MADTGSVDLVGLAGAADGRPVWAHHSEDRSVNLPVLAGGNRVAAPVEAEVDVLVVGVAGGGIVEVDGTPHAVAPGRALVVPKGTERAVRAEGGGSPTPPATAAGRGCGRRGR